MGETRRTRGALKRILLAVRLTWQQHHMAVFSRSFSALRWRWYGTWSARSRVWTWRCRPVVRAVESARRWCFGAAYWTPHFEVRPVLAHLSRNSTLNWAEAGGLMHALPLLEVHVMRFALERAPEISLFNRWCASVPHSREHIQHSTTRGPQ
jgi:hypothetical protein